MKLNLKFPTITLPVNYDKTPPHERRFIREEYVKLQKGLCYYCKSPLNSKPPLKIRKMKLQRGAFPRGFWKYPIHLHHNHDTGMTIGSVHAICNAILWQYHGK